MTTRTIDLLLGWSTRTHTAGTQHVERLTAWLEPRANFADDRGDVTPRTVGIAVMTAAAVGVGTYVTQRITDKAATIDLDNGGITVGG
jgi:hypothetical protein